jgi:hypothetical protein
LAIGTAQQARIAQHQDAAVVGIADQTPGSLLQGYDGLGQLKIPKGIATPLPQGIDSGSENRIPR